MMLSFVAARELLLPRLPVYTQPEWQMHLHDLYPSTRYISVAHLAQREHSMQPRRGVLFLPIPFPIHAILAAIPRGLSGGTHLPLVLQLGDPVALVQNRGSDFLRAIAGFQGFRVRGQVPALVRPSPREEALVLGQPALVETFPVRIFAEVKPLCLLEVIEEPCAWTGIAARSPSCCLR